MILDRDLSSINRKLLKTSEILQTSIRERLHAGGSVAVLEIGCGVGAALMELAWEFRNDPVGFTGINRDAGAPLAGREDFARVAREMGIGNSEERGALELPELFFEDATELHFEDESFDVVFASSVLRWVPKKAELFEQVGRVLKPGGVALIRVSGKQWNYPYSLADNNVMLTTNPSRWVLRHQRELIPLDIYLRAAADERFTFEFLNAPACVVKMRKLGPGNLDLGLRFDESLSLDMRQLPYGDDRIGYAKGGVRSVYDISDARYRMLFERGFLSPEMLQETAAEEVRYEDNENAKRNFERLARYEIGLRIKIKGRLADGSFHAAKIKMIRDEQAEDHVESIVEDVRADTGMLTVLGIRVQPTERSGRAEAGAMVRVNGRYESGTFVADEILTIPTPAIQVDQLQACIEAVDPARGWLRVANIPVITSASTKIDRPHRR